MRSFFKCFAQAGTDFLLRSAENAEHEPLLTFNDYNSESLHDN